MVKKINNNSLNLNNIIAGENKKNANNQKLVMNNNDPEDVEDLDEEKDINFSINNEEDEIDSDSDIQNIIY